MKQMGRPRKEIDFGVFENLCKIQCSQESIALFFEMDVQTLQARILEQYGETFSQVFARKRDLGITALRQKQFEVALKGNVQMMIWLSKNFLNQKDKTEIDHTSSDGSMTPKEGLAGIPINSEIFQDLLRLDEKLKSSKNPG